MKKNHFFTIFATALFFAAGAEADKLTTETILAISGNSQYARSVTNRGELQAYIRISSPQAVTEMETLGVIIDSKGTTIVTARIPLDVLEKVGQLETVECIQAVQPAKELMDKAMADTRVNEVHLPMGREFSTPYTGKGVIVASIDGGMDFTHLAFYNSERTTTRFKRAWIHDDNSGTPPEGFSYGTEFVGEEALMKKATDLAYYAHGSHVLNIAAGANLSSPYHGIAYDADLMFSNFADIDKGISDGISYLFTKAAEYKQPIVVNMSLGTEMGPHDGTALRDVLSDELTGEGKILVGAAGNNGMIDTHISKTFTDSVNVLYTGLAFLQDYAGTGELQIWGEPGKSLKVQLLTVDKQTLEPVYESRNYDCSKYTTTTVTLQKPYDQSSGFFKIITQISPLNQKPMAHITTSIGDFSGKCIAIKITGEAGSTVHAWANQNMCCFRKQVEGMDVPDHDYGVCEIGGTGKNIITVGSYNTRNSIKSFKDELMETGFNVGEISPFSDHGPTADGRMKPDVAAPGSLIVSALNSNAGTDASMVTSVDWNGKTYPYGAMQGTSMAAPHVAGAIGLWLQAAPKLTPAQVRETLDNSCRLDSMTSGKPDNTWGRGKLDVYKGLVYVLKNFANQSDVDAVVDECRWSANIIDGNLRILHYGLNKDLRIEIFTASGGKVFATTYPGSSLGDETVLPLSNLQEGIYIAKISSHKQAKTIKIRI